MNRTAYLYIAAIAFGILPANSTLAASFDVTVRGSDAIFLAGRTDVAIPQASSPWNGPGTRLIRHGGPTPEEIQESIPPFISVAAGDAIRVFDPAVGGVSFYNGFGAPFFGPSGNGSAGSSLTSLDGISGYIGPQGPLVGVFLDDSIPNSGPAPATLDFTLSGLGTNFSSLSPLLRQVFYIGDGLTSSAAFQTFIAPTGSTRLFLGIPDGFGFGGAPGAYDDNDGSYRVRIGVNDIPTPTPVPEPSSLMMIILSAGVLAGSKRRQGVSKV